MTLSRFTKRTLAGSALIAAALLTTGHVPAIAQGTGGGAAGSTGTGSAAGGTVGSSTGVGDAASVASPGGNGVGIGATTSGAQGQSTAGNSTTSPGTTTAPATGSGQNAPGTTGSNTGGKSSGASAPSGTTAGSNAGGNGMTAQGGALTVANGAPATLDLATTIRLTIAASNDYAVATKNLDRDAAQVDEAKAAGRPRLNATGTETYLNKPIIINFGGNSITVEPQSTQDIQLKGSIPIDLTGQLSNGISLYQLQLLADQFQRNRVVNNLILKADTSYFDVLRAQHQLQVTQAALADAQTQQQTATKQFNAGLGLKIDMVRANTQVAAAQQNVLQAQNMLALAQTNLNDATGRPLNAAVSAVDVPGVTTGVAVQPTPAIVPPNAGQTAPISAEPAQAPTFFEPPMADLTAIDLDKSISEALQNRPELLADQVNINAAHRQIKLAHRGIEPSLNLSASGDEYPTTSFQSPYHQVGALVATVTVPLYDGGLTRDQVREARDSEDNAKSTYASNQTDVQLQVRQAYLSLLTAGQQIGSANTALQEAVIARQLAQVRYANGVGLYLEVTDAESALTSAETNQVNAVYGYLVARSQFENAVGLPTTNPSL